MHTFLVILGVILFLFLEGVFGLIMFISGFFFPGAIYSNDKTYPIWENGYMPIMMDMKKYFREHEKFAKYDFKKAVEILEKARKDAEIQMKSKHDE